jgi:hypothetical protein
MPWMRAGIQARRVTLLGIVNLNWSGDEDLRQIAKELLDRDPAIVVFGTQMESATEGRATPYKPEALMRTDGSRPSFMVGHRKIPREADTSKGG